MAVTALRFETTSDMFGINVDLVDATGDHRFEIVRGLQVDDPFRNMRTRMKSGYLFRRPNIPDTEWSSVLESLANTAGPYKLTVSMVSDEKGPGSITALLRFAEQQDAAMWAWTHTSTWQKWSDELEKESKKSSDNKVKIFVDKDGKLKARVTVSTLGESS